MQRRVFIGTVGAALLATPLLAHAQPARPLRRIGLLEPGTVPTHPSLLEGLRALGWIEGQNIIIERRTANDNPQLVPVLAAELVRLEVDLIVTFGTAAAQAAHKASSTIPIVTAVIGDPVRAGLAASLARPGGNVTGNTLIEAELRDKRLQILKELLPGATRIGVLINPATPGVRPASGREDDEVVRGLGLQLIFVEVRDPAGLDQAFAELARHRVQALVVPLDSLFLGNRDRIMDLASRQALPTMSVGRPNVEAGALLSYAPSNAAMLRNAAVFVDKILKGAKPGDLPIERPTRFELIFNLKTAKALGITIPQSLLLRADEVIQ